MTPACWPPTATGAATRAQAIQRALTGTWRAEHLFALEQALALDACREKVVDCDKKIEATLKRIEAQSAKPVGRLPPARSTKRQPNAVDFDVRTALHAVLGVDLTRIHGLGPYLALKLVGECGTDLSAWPNAKHFTSWLGLAPSNKISGGKVLSSRTRRSGSRAASLLRLAAVTVGRTDTALGAFFRRLSGPCRQGQGRHRHGPQDRGALLQHPAPWDGLCRSRRLLLRGALPAEGSDQSPEAGEVAGLRPPTG